MSGDTDKAKISDNQDEDKKSGTGDGHTTEDDSSQDSKGESQPLVEGEGALSAASATAAPEGPGNAVDPAETPAGDAKSTTANGKNEDAGIDKDEKRDAKLDGDLKKEENGETHEDDEDDVKENDKGAKKPAPKKKAKKEDTEEEEEDEEDEEEEEDEEGEEGDEDEEPKPAKEKVKKPAKKAKAGDEEGDDEEGDEEEGEVEEEEEEEEEEAPKPKPKKEPSEPPVPLPAGKGIPLGHISNVEVSLSRFKTQDQKLLHQYLYGQLCLDRNVKRNIKKFRGYEWSIGSSDYKAKLEETSKMEMKQLRTMCEMLDLDKKGGAQELSARLVGFLQQPAANSPHARAAARPPPAAHAAPGGRPRRSAALLVNRGYSDEEYETDPETKVKGPKPAREGSEDSDGSFNPSGSEEGDSDFDPEAGEGAGGTARKRRSAPRRRSSGKSGRKSGRKGKGKQKVKKPGRGRRARSDSEDESEKSESESDNESGSEGEESDEPKSKRGRPSGAVAKGRKGQLVKNVKATPVKRKAPTPPAKKKATTGKPGRPPKKGKKASSEEESAEGSEGEEESGEEEEESGEESDTPADKKAKRPPTDEEIKKYVKQILEGANLEQITMKTVCKQVYSHYPDFDLAHKKDFIKATVKSLISS